MVRKTQKDTWRATDLAKLLEAEIREDDEQLKADGYDAL